MKVAIDISQIAYKGSGVARYMQTLVEALQRYDTQNSYTLFYSSLRTPLSEDIKNTFSKKAALKIYHFPPSILELFWNKLHIVPIDILIGKQDILITSDWTEPPSSFNKITILHDLIFLKFAETFKKTSFNLENLKYSPDIVETQKRRIKWVHKESKYIICDSNTTKEDAMSLLNISSKKLKVIYPAVETKEPTQIQINEILKKYHIEKPFILSVGKIEPRKNITRLIEAFNKAELNNTELLIVGPLGWEEEKIMKNTKNIRFLGFVSDDELYSLYKSALFFVYPSLYEGFGLPVVEAMSLGCPVATSNTSSLKEIADGYGILFNPEKTSEIVDALKKLFNDKKLRNNLSELGKKRALDFNIKSFAQQFITIFNSI